MSAWERGSGQGKTKCRTGAFRAAFVAVVSLGAGACSSTERTFLGEGDDPWTCGGPGAPGPTGGVIDGNDADGEDASVRPPSSQGSPPASPGGGGTDGGTSTPDGDAPGGLVVEVSTGPVGGSYAPANVGAVWIVTEDGRYVKTLEVWGAKRRRHLVRWNAESRGDTVDAITAATARSHRAHTSRWNGRDDQGRVAPGGTYSVVLELTDDNSASPGNPPAALLRVPFEHGGAPVDVATSQSPAFRSVRVRREEASRP